MAAPGQAAPIRSRAELTHYLKTTPPGSSPLDGLSLGGSKRFLAQLVFNRRGLAEFSYDDPEHELNHAQIVQLFALFGAKQYAQGLGLTAQERARFERERLADAKLRGCSISRCPESAIEQRYDQLVLHPDDTSASRTARLAQLGHRYDRLFAVFQTPQKLRSVDDRDLRLLKRAAGKVVSGVPSNKRITQLQATLAEMHRRVIADDKDFASLYRAWVADRDFVKAAALVQQRRGMGVEPLPFFRKGTDLAPGQPTVLTLAPDGRTMTRESFDLSTPVRIVVVASCHFSQDAARAIKADAQLRPLFAQHGTWLAGQNDSFNGALQWNREFPEQPIHIAWKDSEWSRLDDWNMPTFYVFRHGKLMDKWSGWPADTGMQTLREHLRKSGLL